MTKKSGLGDDGDSVEQHESFGLVQFNRISCGGKVRLFGSSIRDHGQTIRLRIFRNVSLIRAQSGDSYYAPNRPDIEVEMSAAQYAELLTTMNVGFGVPCTVRSFDGKRVSDPPDLAAEAVNVKGTFEKRMKQAAEALCEQRDQMAKNLEEMKIPKKHWETLMAPINKACQEVALNAPFWLETFEEATEKIVTSAKAEVDAFTTSAIHRAGIKALQDGSAQLTLPAAPTLNEENEDA